MLGNYNLSTMFDVLKVWSGFIYNTDSSLLLIFMVRVRRCQIWVNYLRNVVCMDLVGAITTGIVLASLQLVGPSYTSPFA